MGIAASQPAEPSTENRAFVFIKPHALTEAVQELVSSTLTKGGFNILEEGRIDATIIDEKKLIDQHYYAIASKATILKPAELNVPAAKFKEKFGLEWSEALSKSLVFNAMDACKKLGVDAAQMASMWNQAKDAGQLIKFGGGFYCGKLTTDQGDLYVFNGFFMSMRAKFVEPGSAIYYYVVEWESAKLNWADFRGSVLGPTDPATAPADSLRGAILAKWRDLGLSAEPNVGDNGVHASASPFEALAERMNWLGVSLEEDSFGKAMLD